MVNLPRLVVVLLLASNSALAQEILSTSQDQQTVTVTIYNENLALVKERRKLQLTSGQNTLAFRDVSAQMRPETAVLRSISAPGKLSVLEQNFDFDLLTPEKLLQKFVGKNVNILRTNPVSGAETTESAQVLSANNGVVLKYPDRIETGIAGRMVYPEVPPNLRDRPTLVMSLHNSGGAQQEVELSYLTGGLGWKADYVAALNDSENKMDLSGWITLTNTSGAAYGNAKLQLVAGDVNQVRPRQGLPGIARAQMAMVADAAAPVREEALLEYHLYELDRPTTIAENQSKQVALMSAHQIPVRKELLLSGEDYYYQNSVGNISQKTKAGVFLEFDNTDAAHLGLPLPKGIMRVYKDDHNGNAQFVGEDNVDHTAKNEKVRLKLGQAFDVTADKKQTDFKKLPNSAKGGGAFESAYEIVLKNAKKQPVMVTVQEPVPGDWKIIKSSHEYTKAASNSAVWKVPVPAEGTATLGYRVQVRY